MKGWIWVIAVTLCVAACAYNPKRRAAGWLMVDTEHVRLRTTLSSSSATELAAELQAIRDQLAGAVFRCARSGEASRFSVTVLPASQFADIVPEGVGGQYRYWPVTWVPGYEGQIILPDDLRRDQVQYFQHELTHHLVATCVPHAPPWLHEGLAGLLETAQVDKGHVRIGQMPYVFTRRRGGMSVSRYRQMRVIVLSRGLLPSIEKVLRLSTDDFHTHGGWGVEAMAHYAGTWALVHFLELGAEDLRPRFRAYMTALRDEESDPDALFAAHFGDIDLQERLDRYLESDRFPYVGVRVHAPSRRPPVIRTMSEAEGHLHWAWLWSAAPDSAEQRARMRQHLAAAREDPAVRARARALAAAVLWYQSDSEGAKREVSEGLREAPDDPGLLQADVEIRLKSGVDPSASGARLRKVAVTADQICAVAGIDLVTGDPKRALDGVRRGLAMRPNSRLCQLIEESAYTARKR